MALAAGLLLGLAAAAVLAGCGGGGGAKKPIASTLPQTGRPVWQQLKSDRPVAPAPTIEPVPEVGDGRDKLAAYAMDLQSLFEQIKSPPPGDPGETPGEPPGGSTATSQAPSLSGPSGPVASVSAPAPAAEPSTPRAVDAAAAAAATEPWTPDVEVAAVEPTQEERKAELLAQLTSLLGRAAGHPDQLAGEGPLSRAVRLAALEAVQPGIAQGELDRLEAQLLPSEAAVLRPLRELFSRLGGSAAAQEDPAAIAGLMDEYARRLAQARPLSIPAAVLCERVESFGRYTPFRGTTFAAGREHTAILYVEVESFVQRTAPGDATPGGRSEQWITELGQTLDLHHDADGSLQWRQAEQVIRDASRRRRSDYYLVQRITLPSTLSVGKYNLKVTVNDKVSGGTAQARIPIQIVADPSLAKTP